MRRTSRRLHTPAAALVCCALALILVPLARAQSGGGYQLTQTVIPGGGGASTAGAQRLDGTIGQGFVGTASGGGFVVESGFGPTAGARFQIGGRITLATDGSPLAGVNVTLTNSGGTTLSMATLDANGFYKFTNLAAGAYNVTPARLNFSFSPASRTVTLGASATDADFAATSSATRLGVAGGALLISEFRLSGMTDDDEYIELYNNTDAALDIGGYYLDALTVGVFANVPAGTTLAPRAHYLIARAPGTGFGYTLTPYAAPDLTYATDLPATTGIALFNPANQIVDAVGSTVAAEPYREGAGLPAPSAPAQYAFYRDMASTGRPADAGDNAQDFRLVATDTAAFAASSLGAPAPENLAAPVQRNAQVKAALVAPCVASSAFPNRLRTGSGDAGTLSIRRKFINRTGLPVTRLRFRVIDITTGPTQAGSGVADLRAVTSADSVDANPCGAPVSIRQLLLEEPPAQVSGGGFNSSLNTGFVTLAQPLAPGASANVNFLLSVIQAGSFRFLVNVEADTAAGLAAPKRALKSK